MPWFDVEPVDVNRLGYSRFLLELPLLPAGAADGAVGGLEVPSLEPPTAEPDAVGALELLGPAPADDLVLDSPDKPDPSWNRGPDGSLLGVGEPFDSCATTTPAVASRAAQHTASPTLIAVDFIMTPYRYSCGYCAGLVR